MTSARSYRLSEMVFEAADYLDDNDHVEAGRLHETGELLATSGGGKPPGRATLVELHNPRSRS